MKYVEVFAGNEHTLLLRSDGLLAVGMIMFHHWSLEFATSAVISPLGQTLFCKSVLFVKMTQWHMLNFRR